MTQRATDHSTAAIRADSGIDIAGCHAYILSRQTPQGGFCFYRYAPWGVEEPNAVDTWAAVTSLDLLGYPVPGSERLVAWLRDLQNDNGRYPTLVIAEAVLFTLLLLNTKPSHDPCGYLLEQSRRIGDPSPLTKDWRSWLDNARRCARLLSRHALPLSALRENVQPQLIRLRDPSGGYVVAGPSVLDTWHALDLTCQLRLEPDLRQLGFVRACERAHSGITLTPESDATSLEVQLAGLYTLRLFAAHPQYPAVVNNLVTSCQCANGGFARVPGALPRLHDTCRALAVLTILNDTFHGRTDEVRCERPDNGFR
jgi:hypothetical protein